MYKLPHKNKKSTRHNKIFDLIILLPANNFPFRHYRSFLEEFGNQKMNSFRVKCFSFTVIVVQWLFQIVLCQTTKSSRNSNVFHSQFQETKQLFLREGCDFLYLHVNAETNSWTQSKFAPDDPKFTLDFHTVLANFLEVDSLTFLTSDPNYNSTLVAGIATNYRRLRFSTCKDLVEDRTDNIDSWIESPDAKSGVTFLWLLCVSEHDHGHSHFEFVLSTFQPPDDFLLPEVQLILSILNFQDVSLVSIPKGEQLEYVKHPVSGNWKLKPVTEIVQEWWRLQRVMHGMPILIDFPYGVNGEFWADEEKSEQECNIHIHENWDTFTSARHCIFREVQLRLNLTVTSYFPYLNLSNVVTRAMLDGENYENMRARGFHWLP